MQVSWHSRTQQPLAAAAARPALRLGALPPPPSLPPAVHTQACLPQSCCRRRLGWSRFIMGTCKASSSDSSGGGGNSGDGGGGSGGNNGGGGQGGGLPHHWFVAVLCAALVRRQGLASRD